MAGGGVASGLFGTHKHAPGLGFRLGVRKNYGRRICAELVCACDSSRSKKILQETNLRECVRFRLGVRKVCGRRITNMRRDWDFVLE